MGLTTTNDDTPSTEPSATGPGDPSRRPPLTLLGIFPHPDDEAYTCGGTLAKAAAAGATVHVVCATRGEAGERRDPALLASEPIGELRVRELQAACAALGVQPPRFLGFRDGALPELDLAEAAGGIVRIIRELKPDVVVSLGPDGVYGHADHIALHKMMIPAFRSAGGGSRFPEEQFGPPHQPARLFWVAYPRGLFRPEWERLLTTDLAAGMRRINPDRLGVGDDEIHAVIDIRDHAAVKLAALRAHRSQLDGGDPYSLFPAGVIEQTLAVERFTLAIGEQPDGRLADLFEGLR